jgi:hypothetical protein
MLNQREAGKIEFWARTGTVSYKLMVSTLTIGHSKT